jgi:hypothetical protein
MPAAVAILTPVTTVQPGGNGSVEVRVRNTGTVVDQFALNLVGEASAWARCEPPVLSLFPNAEETIKVTFTPPRSSTVVAGLIPFGVRVTSQEDPDFSVVEEGSVQIGGFASVEARIVPRTSEGKRKAVHRVEVKNTGNSAVTAELAASDPDELLAFGLAPATLSIEPGVTAVSKLKVAARKAHSGKGPRRMPFNVVIQPGGAPVQVEATFSQKPRGSIFLLIAILVLVAVLAYLLTQT